MRIKKEELRRKILHLGNSIIPLGYYFFVPGTMKLFWVLSFITIVFVTVDFLRSRIERIKGLFELFFSSMLRKHELDGKMTGATWVLIGSTLTVYLFEKDIAILALLFMSVGDTVAALVGQQFGKIKIGEKTLEGFAGAFFSCLAISYFFPTLTWINRLAGSLSAGLIELSPISIDDNLKIPIVSGTVMTLLSGIGL